MCELNNIKKNKGCFKIELKKNQGLLEILCTPKENENIIPKGQKELYLQIEDTINVIDSSNLINEKIKTIILKNYMT